MNEGNVVIVVLIVIGIIIFANGMMFLAARGFMRGDKTTRNFLDSTQDTLRQPFQKEDKALEELRKRVEELENK
jgi:Sec-independent protein translocase protein TatA